MIASDSEAAPSITGSLQVMRIYGRCVILDIPCTALSHTRPDAVLLRVFTVNRICAAKRGFRHIAHRPLPCSPCSGQAGNRRRGILWDARTALHGPGTEGRACPPHPKASERSTGREAGMLGIYRFPALQTVVW